MIPAAPVPAAVAAAVRTFLRGVITGDAPLLASVCRPHAGLARLTAVVDAPAAVARDAAAIAAAPLAGMPLPGDRFLVRALLAGGTHLVLLHDVASSPRVDARYTLALQGPDDEPRRVVRRFWRALRIADGATLAELAFDVRGIELLVGAAPAATERALLERAADCLAIVRLEPGEAFFVPNGVEFVGRAHAELGVEVHSALAPDGEFPFLLRRRDAAWRVIAFHFIQAAMQARSASSPTPTVKVMP
jgi:hypothetical protein